MRGKPRIGHSKSVLGEQGVKPWQILVVTAGLMAWLYYFMGGPDQHRSPAPVAKTEPAPAAPKAAAGKRDKAGQPAPGTGATAETTKQEKWAHSAPGKAGEPTFASTLGKGGGDSAPASSPVAEPKARVAWMKRWFPALAVGPGGGKGAGGAFSSADSGAGGSSSGGGGVSIGGSGGGVSIGGAIPIPGAPAFAGGGGGATGAGGGGSEIVANSNRTSGAPRPDFGSRGTLDLGPGGGRPTNPQNFVDQAFGPVNTAVLQSFLNEAHLNVPQVSGMQYSTLDLDDGIAGINAYDPLRNANVTMLATAGRITAAQLQAFLDAGDTGIPALAGVSVPSPLGAANTIPAQPGSGLADAQGWTFTSGGNTIQLALMQRSDGQGSYLAVVRAPGSTIDGAEEYYAQFYQQLAAR